MNEQNLKLITTSERARELGSLGGKTITPEKKIAAKLRELKKKGLNDETAKTLYELMTNPDVADLDILTWIRGMRSMAGSLKEREVVANLELNWKKQRHGTKDRAENHFNLNMNDKVLNITFEIPEVFKDGSKDKADGKTVASVEEAL